MVDLSELEQQLIEARKQTRERVPPEFMQVIDGLIADLERSHLPNILDVGDEAPDFTLTAAQDGRQYTLSKSAAGGPVIVSFYRGQW